MSFSFLHLFVSFLSMRVGWGWGGGWEGEVHRRSDNLLDLSVEGQEIFYFLVLFLKFFIILFPLPL